MASGTIPKYMDGTDTGWIEYKGVAGDGKTYNGSIFCRRQGNIVFVRGYNVNAKTAVSAGGAINLMTLDAQFRPVDRTGTSAMTNTGTGGIRVFPVMAFDNGYLYVYANNDVGFATNTAINFSLVYSAN